MSHFNSMDGYAFFFVVGQNTVWLRLNFYNKPVLQ